MEGMKNVTDNQGDFNIKKDFDGKENYAK